MRSSRLARALAVPLVLVAASASAADGQACADAAGRAQAMRNEGKLRETKSELLVCAQASCPAVIKQDCERWLAEVEASLPSIVVSAHDERGRDLVDVRVFADDELLLPLLTGRATTIEPGLHALRFEREGHAAVVERVLIREGEKNRLVTAVFGAAEPKPSAEPGNVAPAGPRAPLVSLPTYVFGGIGVAALGSFAYFGWTAQQRYDDLRRTCAPTQTCTEPALDAVRTRSLVADVSLGVGIVSIGVAVAFVLIRAKPPAPSAVRLEPQAIRGGFAAAVGGNF